MLKVLLVDDEPFILQGLKVLVDWKEEGYEIATASSGKEALEYARSKPVDLIISDIRMPEMSGLELLKLLRHDYKVESYFVILSGYAEFEYAQEAMHYNCTDYVLKPVEKEQLLNILRKVADLNKKKFSQREENEKQHKAYIDRTLMGLLNGKFDSRNIEYLENDIDVNEDMCYVGIQLEIENMTVDCSDEEKKKTLEKLYAAAQSFLKEDSWLCIFDVSDSEKVYDIGLIYHDSMSKKRKTECEPYLQSFLEYIHVNTNLPVTMLVGKRVSGIRNISKSYCTVNMLRSLQGFREKKEIYFYDREYRIKDNGVLICKRQLDELIDAIELAENNSIRKKVDALYEEMKKSGITEAAMNLNINYLLFQLIHLASEFDSEVNQDEILRIILESTNEEGMRRGGKKHLCKMAIVYAEYISQLRKNSSKGVLGQIEEEIKKNYAKNLTLKDLSEKYYLNSAYLGQLFRKKYGCSFKDYLNEHRMEEAAKLLKNSEMKIYEVADAVGFKDVDYFVNKFIAAKGCTPTKYKKTETV